ncbi:hypothetical protein NEOLEDRAFT_376186 [Neolentinus lepideus HHB14362 ss-1]|uniref:Uncharacterized protein n=1 Tax=Neolentinus lepideus HHB14362 ss-1 TaxID=1314782 RepID=A0A165SJJ9_9AGAM|nr:hypothetical protein NEOLEDRAFT_376186 [Neolentinus lepideus HHB14362 ss-1]
MQRSSGSRRASDFCQRMDRQINSERHEGVLPSSPQDHKESFERATGPERSKTRGEEQSPSRIGEAASRYEGEQSPSRVRLTQMTQKRLAPAANRQCRWRTTNLA